VSESVYEDAGAIVIYTWTQNGTTIIKNNIIINASFAISMEETYLTYIYNNTIIDSDIGISIVQRDSPYYLRPSQRGYGGINYIHNNTMIGDMSFCGLNLYGHQKVFADNNVMINGTATFAGRASVLVYHSNPCAEGKLNQGTYYINNTQATNCGTGLFMRSMSAAALGTLEVHVNNFTVVDSNADVGAYLYTSNKTSTYENISITHKTGTYGTEGICVQYPRNGTLSNIYINGYEQGLCIQQFNTLVYRNITIENCDYGISYRPTGEDTFVTTYVRPHLDSVLYYDINTSGCVYDARSDGADTGDIWDDANLTIAGMNYGASLDFFTAGSKTIILLDYANFTSSLNGTLDAIKYGNVYNSTYFNTSTNQQLYIVKFSSKDNETTSGCNARFTQDDGAKVSVLLNGTTHSVLYLDGANLFGVTYQGNYTIGAFTPYNSLNPLFELLDDSGTLTIQNIGALCSATIFIVGGIMLSMLLLLTLAMGSKSVKGFRRYR